mmetsp:Transcript_29357/g.84967  ORF Transcript_29357/g.84967 Transcript_29357/m.84967 type:complete len:232 (-) Transcript_29357:585-1280(-)
MRWCSFALPCTTSRRSPNRRAWGVPGRQSLRGGHWTVRKPQQDNQAVPPTQRPSTLSALFLSSRSSGEESIKRRESAVPHQQPSRDRCDPPQPLTPLTLRQQLRQPAASRPGRHHWRSVAQCVCKEEGGTQQGIAGRRHVSQQSGKDRGGTGGGDQRRRHTEEEVLQRLWQLTALIQLSPVESRKRDTHQIQHIQPHDHRQHTGSHRHYPLGRPARLPEEPHTQQTRPQPE